MAGNPDYDPVISTTLENYGETLYDAITENNALLRLLRETRRLGFFSSTDGGAAWLCPLKYNDGTSTVSRVAGWDPFDTRPTEGITAARFPMSIYINAFLMSGEEDLKNSGKEQVFKLWEALMENAEAELANTIDDDLYSDGQAYGGKQLDGLQALIPDNPNTGTVGGINRALAANAFYRPKMVSGTGMSSSNVVGFVNQLMVQSQRMIRAKNGIGRVYLAGNDAYRYFLESTQGNQRFIEGSRMAAMGFDSLRYGASEFVLGGGQGSELGAKRIYQIDPYGLKFLVHRRLNFRPLEGGIRRAYDRYGKIHAIGAAVVFAAAAVRDCGVIVGS